MRINWIFPEKISRPMCSLGLFLSISLFSSCSDNQRKIVLIAEPEALLIYKDGEYYGETPVEIAMEEPPEDLSQVPYGVGFLDGNDIFEGFTVYGAKNVEPDEFFTFHQNGGADPITFPKSSVERFTPSAKVTKLVINIGD